MFFMRPVVRLAARYLSELQCLFSGICERITPSADDPLLIVAGFKFPNTHACKSELDW